MNAAMSAMWESKQAEMADRVRAATEARRGWTFDFVKGPGRSNKWHWFNGANTSVCGALVIEADAQLITEGHKATDACRACLKVFGEQQGRLGL